MAASLPGYLMPPWVSDASLGPSVTPFPLLSCWLSLEGGLLYAFMGPAAVIVLVCACSLSGWACGPRGSCLLHLGVSLPGGRDLFPHQLTGPQVNMLIGIIVFNKLMARDGISDKSRSRGPGKGRGFVYCHGLVGSAVGRVGRSHPWRLRGLDDALGLWPWGIKGAGKVGTWCAQLQPLAHLTPPLSLSICPPPSHPTRGSHCPSPPISCVSLALPMSAAPEVGAVPLGQPAPPCSERVEAVPSPLLSSASARDAMLVVPPWERGWAGAKEWGQCCVVGEGGGIQPSALELLHLQG